MQFQIGIEDLAANALIALINKIDCRFVSYKDIEAYGNEVVSLLNEKNEKAVLVLSRENTTMFYHDYSDFFEEKEFEGEVGIYLLEGKSVDDLLKKFCGYVALDVILALNDVRSLNKIRGFE